MCTAIGQVGQTGARAGKTEYELSVALDAHDVVLTLSPQADAPTARSWFCTCTYLSLRPPSWASVSKIGLPKRGSIRDKGNG